MTLQFVSQLFRLPPTPFPTWKGILHVLIFGFCSSVMECFVFFCCFHMFQIKNWMIKSKWYLLRILRKYLCKPSNYQNWQSYWKVKVCHVWQGHQTSTQTAQWKRSQGHTAVEGANLIILTVTKKSVSRNGKVEELFHYATGSCRLLQRVCLTFLKCVCNILILNIFPHTQGLGCDGTVPRDATGRTKQRGGK